MQVPFSKYHGGGNDFIIIDDRRIGLSLSPQTISRWCRRRTGVGADGLILLRDSLTADFEMIYFNADGKVASFCGNGGRCIADFAHRMLNITRSDLSFQAADGIHHAILLPDHQVQLSMRDVLSVDQQGADYILNTGSPHFVRWVAGLDQYPVEEHGRMIRHLPQFEPDGINVNFIQQGENGLIKIRTYERGVEAETLACGTGIVAAAIATCKDQTGHFSIQLQTKNKDFFEVSFHKTDKDKVDHIRLTGPVCFTYEGVISFEEIPDS